MRHLVLIALSLVACSDRGPSGARAGDTRLVAGDAPGGDPSAADGGDPAPGDRIGGDPFGGDPAAGDDSGDPVYGDRLPGDPGDASAGDRGDVSSGDPSAGDPNPGDVTPLACEEAGLCVRLAWDASAGDLDLHLSRDDAAWCSYESCYFGNCKGSSAYRVDWDGAAGLTDGDPTLVEDSWGWGPELIRVPDPTDGTYTAGVYYQPSSGDPITATVELIIGGTTVSTTSATLQPDGFWEAAALVLTGSGHAAAELDRVCAAGDWSCNDPVGTCP